MSTPKSWQRYMSLGVFSAEAPRGYGCVPAEMLEEIEAPVTGRALLAETERRDTLWSAVKDDLTRRAASDRLHQLSIADINPGPLPTEYQTEPTPNYARPLTGPQPATLGGKGPPSLEEALVAAEREALLSKMESKLNPQSWAFKQALAKLPDTTPPAFRRPSELRQAYETHESDPKGNWPEVSPDSGDGLVPLAKAIADIHDAQKVEGGWGVQVNPKVLELLNRESAPHGLDPHQPGAKLDAGKNRLGLVMRGFTRALFEVGRVGTYGAEKYTDNGWVEVENGKERYMDAAYRHLAEDELSLIDTGTTLFHLAQAAWNLLAVLELRLREMER